MEALYQLSYSPKGNGVRYQRAVTHHNDRPSRVIVNITDLSALLVHEIAGAAGGLGKFHSIFGESM